MVIGCSLAVSFCCLSPAGSRSGKMGASGGSLPFPLPRFPLFAAVSEPQSFQIRVELNGQPFQFPCRADQTVLAAAEAAGVPLPSSCTAGVCTTCAAVLRSGTVHQPDAMGVNPELREKGYALLCVASPRSDLEVLAGQEDALYEAQFGQYQK